MAITIKGNYPSIVRFSSGLYSLDMALQSPSGAVGLPLRSIYEVYGRPGVGKSSLCYYLGGMTGKVTPGKQVDICDLEILDPDYVVSSFEHTGFDGTINFIGTHYEDGKDKGKRKSHEAMVQELQSNLELDEVSCGILDSVGAIVPIAEDVGEIGEANMGRRAKAVSQMARKVILSLRDLVYPKNLYVVNHVLSIIGGQGHTTPGGEAVKFLGAIRIMVYQDEVIENSKKESIAFVAKGSVEKLRYGAKGKKFKFVVIPGYGVSRELSALVDCVDLGLATRKSVVKLGKETIGYMSKLVESAKSGYNKTFQPFFDALEEYKEKSTTITSPDMETYDESEPVNFHEDEAAVEAEE